VQRIIKVIMVVIIAMVQQQPQQCAGNSVPRGRDVMGTDLDSANKQQTGCYSKNAAMLFLESKPAGNKTDVLPNELVDV
jgi:hypothetical protein